MSNIICCIYKNIMFMELDKSICFYTILFSNPVLEINKVMANFIQ